MSKFHIMIKDENGEWDYFFKKEDFAIRDKNGRKVFKNRNDLGQNDQFHARENAKQISRRKNVGEIAIFYQGEQVDLFVKGKLIEGREVKTKIKPMKEGV